MFPDKRLSAIGRIKHRLQEKAVGVGDYKLGTSNSEANYDLKNIVRLKIYTTSTKDLLQFASSMI
jgi:hypothetical protein